MDVQFKAGPCDDLYKCIFPTGCLKCLKQQVVQLETVAFIFKLACLDPLAFIIPYKNASPSYFWHHWWSILFLAHAVEALNGKVSGRIQSRMPSNSPSLPYAFLFSCRFSNSVSCDLRLVSTLVESAIPALILTRHSAAEGTDADRGSADVQHHLKIKT